MLKRSFILFAILACVVGSDVDLPRAQEDEIHWLDNYRAAIEQAKRTQKPMFIEFRCEP